MKTGVVSWMWERPLSQRTMFKDGLVNDVVKDLDNLMTIFARVLEENLGSQSKSATAAASEGAGGGHGTIISGNNNHNYRSTQDDDDELFHFFSD